MEVHQKAMYYRASGANQSETDHRADASTT